MYARLSPLSVMLLTSRMLLYEEWITTAFQNPPRIGGMSLKNRFMRRDYLRLVFR